MILRVLHPHLQHISTGGATVHVLVILRDLDTLDNALQLAQVAVCRYNLACVRVQLPHTKCQAEGVYCRPEVTNPAVVILYSGKYSWGPSFVLFVLSLSE